MTLTTEKLNEIYENPEQCSYSEIQEMAAMLANRVAQPVAGELGEISVGRLPTMNQEEYPGLGDWWVQLRIGASGDEILARVYGATPDEAVARARALTAPPAPELTDEAIDRIVVPLSPDGLDEEKHHCEWHLYHDRERIRKELREYFAAPRSPEELDKYTQGVKDGLEWAARTVEANHPNTGDWLYDDRDDLAKAIRKGPDMLAVAPEGGR